MCVYQLAHEKRKSRGQGVDPLLDAQRFEPIKTVNRIMLRYQMLIGTFKHSKEKNSRTRKKCTVNNRDNGGWMDVYHFLSAFMCGLFCVLEVSVALDALPE